MMQITRVLGVAAVFATCLALAGAQARPDAAKVVDEGIVIEDVTLISPERPASVPHAAVVIRDGKIAEIGTGLVAGPHAQRIDGRGRFLIPGLANTHVHVGETAPLDDDAVGSGAV
jgi:imidazolonepropionase-like amidohydrolase